MMADPVSEWRRGRPCRALRPYVTGYLGYRMRGFPPGLHQGLPGRHLTLLISLGAPIDIVRMPDPDQRPASLATVVGGLHTRPATIAHNGDQAGISLELSPLGARRVLGLPAGALGSGVAELTDVLGPQGAYLPELLAEAGTWDAAFAALDRVLAGMLVDAPAVAPEVSRAWERLVATEGQITVAELAREVGWSRRHLAQRFRREFGLSPKETGRVLRFERAARLLRRPAPLGLAGIAHTCGYHDQAHMNREWRVLAGRSPTEWLAEEFPNVQDGAGGTASGSVV